MAKALKEAKLNTSWIQPNEAVGRGHARFRRQDSRAFAAESVSSPASSRSREEIARLGAINSLSQTLLKLTSPGVPDIYQGNEIWDFSLVDPDNRRPVDYSAAPRNAGQPSMGQRPEELFGNWPDGRIKMFLTQRLLHFRRATSPLFSATANIAA